MHQQLQNLIIIYCIVSFLFLLTIIVRLYNGKDITFLRKTDFFKNCDYWCISHFILYFLFFLWLFCTKILVYKFYSLHTLGMH